MNTPTPFAPIVLSPTQTKPEIGEFQIPVCVYMKEETDPATIAAPVLRFVHEYMLRFVTGNPKRGNAMHSTFTVVMEEFGGLARVPPARVDGKFTCSAYPQLWYHNAHTSLEVLTIASYLQHKIKRATDSVLYEVIDDRTRFIIADAIERLDPRPFFSIMSQTKQTLDGIIFEISVRPNGLPEWSKFDLRVDFAQNKIVIDADLAFVTTMQENYHLIPSFEGIE